MELFYPLAVPLGIGSCIAVVAGYIAKIIIVKMLINNVPSELLAEVLEATSGLFKRAGTRRASKHQDDRTTDDTS